MRLLVTSDLHYDPRGHLTDRAAIERMVEAMAKEQPTAVVLAGDLAHGLDAFGACVAMFRPLGCPVYVLAGNHDVWKDKVRKIDSETLWTRELPAATEAAGGVWLEATTARFGNVGLAGSLAWYDYSGIDKDLGIPEHRAGDLKQHLNNDAHWIDWQRTDIAFARELANAFMGRIETLSESDVEHIVLVTHVPIFEAQMHRKKGDKNWGVGNAYFGHLTLGDRVLSEPKLRAVVSGHTHWGVEAQIARRGLGPIDVRVVGSDYKIPSYTRVER